MLLRSRLNSVVALTFSSLLFALDKRNRLNQFLGFEILRKRRDLSPYSVLGTYEFLLVLIHPGL